MAFVAVASTTALHAKAASIASPTSSIRVAVVIDFGRGAHRRVDVLRTCLHVPRGSSGVTVLADAATRLRLAPPTYGSSGLMCTIDGDPTSGCPSQGSNAYWSYWHGGTGWSYASTGPGGFTVANDGVEGWRFEDPAGGGGDGAAPTGTSSFAKVCAEQTAISGTTVPLRASSDAGADAVDAAVGVVAVALMVAAARRWRRTAAA